MAQPTQTLNLFDLQHGWSAYPCGEDEVTFDNRIVWYWGEPDVSSIQVMLSEGLASPVFAQVTVWFRGVGTVHHVADAASLAAYVAKVFPGVQALATQVYTVIE
jgi:hypothetical protein